MLEKEIVRLEEATLQEQEGSLVLHIRMRNPEERTLYAYGSPRRILYDNDTHKLTLCFHDGHVEDDSLISRHLPQPRIVPLEGNAVTDVKVDLPRIIRRVRSAAERGAGEPVTEELRIFEATELNLEVAHQDTPFYFDPKVAKGRQLKEWGRTLATGKFKIQGRRKKR